METPTKPLSGRKAEALRNDGIILEAARTVFIRDPSAPIAAVATEAGVGVSALYRRYGSKEGLLQTLCGDGLTRFIAVAEEALLIKDPWDSFESFVTGIVDSDVHALTVHLAGTFTPTEELQQLALRSGDLATKVFRRAKAAGWLRPEVRVNDVPMLFEQLTAIRLGDTERTATLRRRYLAVHLDGLRSSAATSKLPGPAPTDEEFGARWIPRIQRRTGKT